MRRLLLALSSAALLSAPALAQDWAVDRAASAVTFEARAFDTPLTGAFETFSAEITLDPSDLDAARIEAVVDTSSVSLSNDRYRSSLVGASGLATDAHANARFVSQDVRAVDGGYEAVGELTLKGETRPLTLPFTLDVTGDRAVANGAFSIDRAAFGIGGGDWSDVGPSVTVTVHIEADRADSAQSLGQ